MIDHARAAALLHNQRRGIRPNRLLAWAFADHLLLEPHYECAGDHAGGWETSHLLALHPRTVDPGSIPPKGERLIGAGGRMHPSEATAAFGLETIDRAAELAVREVRHRLDHPEAYRANGTTLSEGRWR